VRRFATLVIIGAGLALGGCAGGDRQTNEGWPIVGVIDGDTIRVRVVSLPPAIQEVHVRVRGIDTPERGAHASCERERELAERAFSFTRARINGARQVEFKNLQWDKYGGRVLAEVVIDGRPLAALLMASGLAAPYSGGTRPNWCFSPERPATGGRGI